MDVKIFNICLLIGWLMVLAGGVILNPGWGIVAAGGLLIALTLIAAYLAGWAQPACTKPDNSESA
ncbi:hypothetical protein [Burkholderia ubonensis]|uniref:hypothetical protein n=1 Tax=Burkholderia ubonensis TaxID=101571 RepID=UPI0007576B1C|nr:hypothetical protein [Burkholderia ubonensis]KVS40466.1 hypothetical protein WK37_21460 [Burkholderia ubonensis]KVS51086.1 hypothetical protein WK38_12410 [Burkholderia ubonensis]KVS76092.1 hypothetical protein WK42_18055 [Burkholderia ubonensis]KVS78330.1 hypothetical protein WK43_02295 [Burkholderia ubonensis]KVS82234.1 hypothetical protein WK44_25120 [Burkholderia ubonensis]